MKSRSMLSVIMMALTAAAAGAAAPGAADKPVVTFSDRGLQALTVLGKNRLADGAVRVTQVRVADSYRNPYEMEDPYIKDTRTFSDASLEVRESRFSPAQKRLTQTFDWGSVAVSYAVIDNRLDLRVEIANTSKQTLERVALDLLKLNVPADAKNTSNGNDLVGAALSSSAPAVTRFNRAFFPAASAGDDLLDDPGRRTARPEAGQERVYCAACYPQAARDHLMATKREARVLGQTAEGVCAACKAETHRPADPLIVAGTPQARPVMVLWEAGAAETLTMKLVMGDEKAPEMLDGVWYVRPVKPGTTDTTEVSLCFGPADADPLQVARQSLEARAKAGPSPLRWPDRRPIGMAHLTYERGPERNPRGWWGFKDTQDDIRTPGGQAAFDKWIMSYADQVINVCEKSGSQGVIVWDLEGKQYPGCVYYGDPRIMKHTAPEMDAMADAFFKRLRDAGLAVGVCLRPTLIYPVGVKLEEVEKYRQPEFFAYLPYTESWDKFNLASFEMQFWAYDELGWQKQTPLNDMLRSPVERLDAKIKYCKQRWGATLFYVDTDYFRRPRQKSGPNAAGGFDGVGPWSQLMMSPDQWAELQRRHPDALLMPEHETLAYWGSTAPYRQPPYDGATPPAARLMYPESFCALALNGNAEAEISKNMPPYREAVQAGDLMMHPGWYGPSTVVTNIYAAAASTAPLRVTVRADGVTALGNQSFANLSALTQAVAAAVKGKPFDDRRVFVQYDPASTRPARAAAIAALKQADAIITWTQPLVRSK